MASEHAPSTQRAGGRQLAPLALQAAPSGNAAWHVPPLTGSLQLAEAVQK
jgi:hypothetical protein